MKILDQEKALALLLRAAVSLQEYRDEVDGETNDSLAREIETFVKEVRVS
jgi:hypothetical protein